MRRNRPVSAAELRHLGGHLCSAASDLHRERILHLDLKPSHSHRAASAGGKIIDISAARALGRLTPRKGPPPREHRFAAAGT